MPQSIKILQADTEPRVTLVIGDSDAEKEITLPLNAETLNNLLAGLIKARVAAGWDKPSS